MKITDTIGAPGGAFVVPGPRLGNRPARVAHSDGTHRDGSRAGGGSQAAHVGEHAVGVALAGCPACFPLTYAESHARHRTEGAVR
jgi:hypothetical protein